MAIRGKKPGLLARVFGPKKPTGPSMPSATVPTNGQPPSAPPPVLPIPPGGKELHFADRFHNEARLSAQINHPNVVRMRDVSEAGGLVYLVMDFVDGHTARQMLFEYRVAWRHLRSGGLLLSDDVSWNRAFWAFTKLHRIQFRNVGEVGVTRKP